MPETISNGKWLWHDMMQDLKIQGELEDVIIDPLSVKDHSCSGTHMENGFCVTWVGDMFLLISMNQYSAELVDAFTKVVGYQPFCRYIHNANGLPTVEWDKVNPEGRYKDLSKNPDVQQLVWM